MAFLSVPFLGTVSFFFSAKKLGALPLSLNNNITNSKVRKKGNGRNKNRKEKEIIIGQLRLLKV
jgi:hypothetical protein